MVTTSHASEVTFGKKIIRDCVFLPGHWVLGYSNCAKLWKTHARDEHLSQKHQVSYGSEKWINMIYTVLFNRFITKSYALYACNSLSWDRLEVGFQIHTTYIYSVTHIYINTISCIELNIRTAPFNNDKRGPNTLK